MIGKYSEERLFLAREKESTTGHHLREKKRVG